MPGGNASHKGSSAKPNVNASGLTNAADDAAQDPQEVVGNRSDASTRTDEAIVNPAAVERPQKPKEQE
ncbi:hypothetical protein ACF3DV_05385 [Chlorogloeopsis fritschii PCC 9212]|jgi:hypothetical protein|uniref:Uncharacterized protein n=1 Tax=Chlorogloeopsis fritschii PCC 6912 TaxID=211165 RepID=A0A3S0XY97_CHLFR|nr:hypothetical protein [Chlorogloeopsis fritschii]MBF2008766.1 hypothetical protein [Chlorogloeopsis fritschii C42_A2020_084]RUR80774.1 hypothetical protein PCC6912_27960 [Chlorogloeopsis fritschii PCC 6912]